MALADSDLTPPEEDLRKAMITGGWVDLRKHDPQADDPSQGAHQGPGVLSIRYDSSDSIHAAAQQ